MSWVRGDDLCYVRTQYATFLSVLLLTAGIPASSASAQEKPPSQRQESHNLPPVTVRQSPGKRAKKPSHVKKKKRSTEPTRRSKRLRRPRRASKALIEGGY